MNASAADGYIEIAKIVRAQGILGQLKILPYTRTPEDFTKYGRVYLRDALLFYHELEILNYRRAGHFIIATVNGINTRSQAEAWQDCVICVHENQLAELPAGEYYIRDLMGYQVVSETGVRIGILTEVIELPVHDVYQVQNEEREWLLPAIPEVIIGIAPERKTITVRLIAGLEDL